MPRTSCLLSLKMIASRKAILVSAAFVRNPLHMRLYADVASPEGARNVSAGVGDPQTADRGADCI